LEEVGEHLLEARKRIRQIEAKALRKVKHPSRSAKADRKEDSGKSFSGTEQVIGKKTRKRPPHRGTLRKNARSSSTK
jgi:hypothetical protein